MMKILIFLLIMMNAINLLAKTTARGPQFEGWYTRFVDKDKNISFAIIGGVFLPNGERYNPIRPLSGYLAIIYQGVGQDKVIVYEEFPKETMIFTDGRAMIGGNQFSDASTYLWKAPGFGEISNKHIDLELNGKIKIKANIGSFDSFPESFFGHENFFKLPEPIRWHVYSLGSNGQYDLLIQDNQEKVSLSGEAMIHQEKNWGMTFPKKWIWMQGLNDNYKSRFALSGGTIKLFDWIPIKAATLGIKNEMINWSFNPFSKKNKIKFSVDPCERTVGLIAKQGTKRVIIHATAPKNSYFSLSVPTKKGFIRDGALETFRAYIKIFLYENDQLLEEINFKDAALEFGGEYMVCHRSKRP